MTRAVPVFTNKIYTLIVLFLTPISNLQLDPAKRLEVHNWLFFQHGGIGPYFGQFGHFFVYAPCKIPYAIDRSETRIISLCEIQFGVDTDMHLNNPKQSVANARCTPNSRSQTLGAPQTVGRKRTVHDAMYNRQAPKSSHKKTTQKNSFAQLGPHQTNEGGAAAAVGLE